MLHFIWAKARKTAIMQWEKENWETTQKEKESDGLMYVY